MTVPNCPLIAPIQSFKQTTLAEDAAGNDPIIRLADADFTFTLNEIYFDDGRFTASNRIKSNMQNGVYELVMPIGRPYSAGTAVFLPLFHVYHADVTGTTWDDATDGKKLLKTSTIDYEMRVAKVLR